MVDDHAINARWEEFSQMDRANLLVAWSRAFGTAPPHFLSKLFMRKALIWQVQSKMLGGLKPNVKRVLKAARAGKPIRTQARQIRTGTQLVREWNGRRYLVEVTDDGFLMGGEHFRSLSAIALRITGTNWSGPRFFGLNAQAGERP